MSLRLGSIAPDFTQQSSEGEIHFHKYIEGSWAVLFSHPPSTGRNFDEILRVIDSLQLADRSMVATPVDWKQWEDVVIAPSLQDPEDLKKRFPKGYKQVKPYLRLTPQP
jgi:alkyl hydroperoxide reductase subunit AhpC